MAEVEESISPVLMDVSVGDNKLNNFFFLEFLGHSLAPIGRLKRSEKLLRETNGDSKLLADPHKHGLIGLQKFQRKKIQFLQNSEKCNSELIAYFSRSNIQ
jgi:hypothetical protein